MLGSGASALGKANTIQRSQHMLARLWHIVCGSGIEHPGIPSLGCHKLSWQTPLDHPLVLGRCCTLNFKVQVEGAASSFEFHRPDDGDVAHHLMVTICRLYAGCVMAPAPRARSHSVVVSTGDSESPNPGSNPGVSCPLLL